MAFAFSLAGTGRSPVLQSSTLLQPYLEVSQTSAEIMRSVAKFDWNILDLRLDIVRLRRFPLALARIFQPILPFQSSDRTEVSSVMHVWKTPAMQHGDTIMRNPHSGTSQMAPMRIL